MPLKATLASPYSWHNGFIEMKMRSSISPLLKFEMEEGILAAGLQLGFFVLLVRWLTLGFM